MLATYQWSLLWDYRSDFFHGLWVAIEVAVVAMILSVIMGIILAAARMSKGPVSWAAVAYINVFRGVPALVSVIWVYFGWSLVLGISFTVFQAAVIALVALYGAFIAEIYRAALEAIPRGQREAGLALGMTPSARIRARSPCRRRPKIAVPNIGSMLIGMVKDTSVFTVIGLVEVVRTTQNINSITFQPFVLYTGAAFLYVIAAFAIDFVFRVIEKSMSTPPKGQIAQDDPRPPTPARGADRPRLPGCGGDGVTNAPDRRPTTHSKGSARFLRPNGQTTRPHGHNARRVGK